MFMSQDAMYYLGEGDFIMFDEIPISTMERPKRQLHPQRQF